MPKDGHNFPISVPTIFLWFCEILFSSTRWFVLHRTLRSYKIRCCIAGCGSVRQTRFCTTRYDSVRQDTIVHYRMRLWITHGYPWRLTGRISGRKRGWVSILIFVLIICWHFVLMDATLWGTRGSSGAQEFGWCLSLFLHTSKILLGAL